MLEPQFSSSRYTCSISPLCQHTYPSLCQSTSETLPSQPDHPWTDSPSSSPHYKLHQQFSNSHTYYTETQSLHRGWQQGTGSFFVDQVRNHDHLQMKSACRWISGRRKCRLRSWGKCVWRVDCPIYCWCVVRRSWMLRREISGRFER